MRERFFGKLVRGVLPLLVWALHFGASYVVVAAQCSPAGHAPGHPQRLPLALMTVTALAVCGTLAWRARHGLARPEEDSTLLDLAAAGSALLALAGIAWTSVPLWLVEGCA